VQHFCEETVVIIIRSSEANFPTSCSHHQLKI